MDERASTFDFLRVALETRIAMPAVVAITSAKLEDRSSYVAQGLANSFASAGLRTILIRNGSSTAQGTLATTSVAKLLADLPKDTATVAHAFAEIRTHYDIAIVDADPISFSSQAFECASEADGVLLAVRLGRKPTDDDRATKRLLEDAKINVLGIAPTRNAGSARKSGFGSAKDDDGAVSSVRRPLSVTR